MPVWIAEGFEQRGNVVQTEFGSENLVAKRVEVSKGVSVLHEKENPPGSV